jgi:hypothetical protein
MNPLVKILERQGNTMQATIIELEKEIGVLRMRLTKREEYEKKNEPDIDLTGISAAIPAIIDGLPIDDKIKSKIKLIPTPVIEGVLKNFLK